MGRSSDAIIGDLERFNPAEMGWEPLGQLLEELMASPTPPNGIDALLGVFERWPGALTAGGWFYPVLHALEGSKGYEEHLLESVGRKPSVLSVMMVGRLLNSDISSINGVPLTQLLREAAVLPTTMRTVKQEIQSVLEQRQPGAKKKRKKPST